MADNALTQLPRIICDTRAVACSVGQCDCNCDCACSSLLETEVPETRQWLSSVPDGSVFSRADFATLDLNDEYVVCYGYHLPTVLLNRSAMSLLSSFDQANSLNSVVSSNQVEWENEVNQSIIKQMLALGLLVSRQNEARVPWGRSHTLTAWIQTTNRCNLHCDYCYLSHQNKDLPLETGYAAIDATMRSGVTHGYKGIKIKYAGGEPLLSFPLITKFHRYAQMQSVQHGFVLDAVVLSNGTLLTAPIIKTMLALDLRLMISLDGIDDLHNRQRSYADGRSSVRDVRRCIELALALGLVPDISVTISGANVEALPELLGWILSLELPFSLNFYRENDNSTHHSELQLEEKRITSGILAAYEVIEARLPHHSLLASLADRANLSTFHQHPCRVGQDYLVFDTEGNVSKCQMQMVTPSTDFLAYDPLSFVQADSNGIRNLSVDEKEDCKRCRWRYWCAGGCPLATYRATGRYDTRSPNCSIYQRLFPEIIRLEGLRLLKYADVIERF